MRGMQLEIQNISKDYKTKKALCDVSFVLENGVYGLVGPNGAGKTTLINILVNVINQTKGSVLYEGKDIRKNLDDYLDVVGYLPQYPKFYREFGCEEFLKYMCELKGIKKRKRKQVIAQALELCNLTQDKERKIKEFSGGMRQRLGIAQAILNNPKILILDEPTAGLDPKERIRFRKIIADLSTERIVILATHIMEDVESIANQVLLMREGRLIGIKSTEELLEEIQGKVGAKSISLKELPSYEKQYVISNVKYEGETCIIRYLTAEVPEEESVVPKLEEVYLYWFSGGDKSNGTPYI